MPSRLVATLLVMLSLLITGCNGSSEIAREQLDKTPPTGFMTRTLKRGIWTRKYAIFVPKSYHPGSAQRYPTIVFLHGIGEGDGFGEGNLKNLTVGLGPAVARKADNFDFIVIFPQSDGGWSPESDYTHDMLTALSQTEEEFPVDKDRVYLTGLSMGGAGTWAIAAQHPDIFAAIVPMASNGSNGADPAALAHMPTRAYCSFLGDLFAGWNDQSMVGRIREVNSDADVKFTATFTVGHDCWENVYGGDELFTWLKAQHRGSAAVANGGPVPPMAPAPMVATPNPAPTYQVYQPAPQPRPAELPPQPVVRASPPPSPAPAPAAPVVTPARPTTPKPASGSGDWVNTPW